MPYALGSPGAWSGKRVRARRSRRSTMAGAEICRLNSSGRALMAVLIVIGLWQGGHLRFPKLTPAISGCVSGGGTGGTSPIHCRVSTPYSPRSTALWFNFSFEYHRYPLSHPGLAKSGAGDPGAPGPRGGGTPAGREQLVP